LAKPARNCTLSLVRYQKVTALKLANAAKGVRAALQPCDAQFVEAEVSVAPIGDADCNVVLGGAKVGCAQERRTFHL
jgi:hypothetical protein